MFVFVCYNYYMDNFSIIIGRGNIYYSELINGSLFIKSHSTDKYLKSKYYKRDKKLFPKFKYLIINHHRISKNPFKSKLTYYLSNN
jgi:hypothetical protein